VKTSINPISLLVIGALGCSEPTPSAWLDTGELDAHGSVLIVEGSGWLAGPTQTIPASHCAHPSVDGWPIAACFDVDADRRCNFEKEPFAMCANEANQLRCTPRPWKLTLTRTQVFDGVLGDYSVEVSPRPDETTVHAAFAAFERRGSVAREADVSLCWSKRGLCSTRSEGDASVVPLKLCGVDEDGAAELELVVGDEHRKQVEALPAAMEVAISRDLTSNDRFALHVGASERIDQALVQIRSPSEKVLWTSTTQAKIHLPAQSFDIGVPDDAVDASEDGSQLLIQLVAVEQHVRDPRLLTQAITETRVWIPLP
jgi:hypothetical protein